MTLPEVAPLGTGTTISVSLQLVGVAGVPLNVIELTPRATPKFAPAIVTSSSIAPAGGARDEITGKALTVNGTPVLAVPPAVTTTLPVVAPLGTGSTICVSLQLVGEAGVPLKVTAPAAPKFAPAMVTAVPTRPAACDRDEITGTVPTMKATPGLAMPPTVTTTLPVATPLGTGTTICVSLQCVGVAGVPLNVTVLAPRVSPKFAPAIITVVPPGAAGGETDEMTGIVPTVKGTPALALPPTVTTTLPVVAPFGTVTTI
jgi:hypothetical protein